MREQAVPVLARRHEGVAVRTCVGCHSEHPVGDSDACLEDAALEECACPCGRDVSLSEGSEDVRWLYAGCRCPSCGLTAVYGDWKNEFKATGICSEQFRPPPRAAALQSQQLGSFLNVSGASLSDPTICGISPKKFQIRKRPRRQPWATIGHLPGLR